MRYTPPRITHRPQLFKLVQRLKRTDHTYDDCDIG